MSNILAFLQEHFPFLLEHKYLLLLLATSLEGFNTMIVAGFLVSIGALKLLPTAGIAVIGEMINSSIWYFMGYFGGAKTLEWFIRKSPKKQKFVEQVRSYMHEHTGKFMMLIKLTYSITTPALLLIGASKYDIKKFTFYNFIGSIGWVIITLTIGYFFGQGYKLYAEYLKDIGYLIVFVVIAVIAVVIVERFSSSFVVTTFNVNTQLEKLNKKIKEGVTKMIKEPKE